jgi:ATP-dependent Lhr-like helicase
MPIEMMNKPFTDEESLGSLNRYVRKWFEKNFKEITPPQQFSFKLITEGKNVLITAPTGSGKTMSGFLSIISKLFDYSLQGKLESKVYCLYISPLRALNNDIYRNLQKPLEEIYDMIKKEKGIDIIKNNIQNVTIGVRTGDTTQQERAQMLKHPPNILVTTPESLAILLNSSKFIENMRTVQYVVIDEIHELANNKRGVHLSLSIERLAAMTYGNFTRIGLGATLYPLEEAARFLAGYNGAQPNDCIIVDASWSKKLDVKVISPSSDLIHTEDQRIEDLTYGIINDIVKKSKTTLIFTNTRSGTERVVFNLKKRFRYNEDIAAHHGSLSRESRLEVEDLLKKGSLKCAVSSTSLELGVDIGSIENVVLLGSPKSVTRAMQRIGRAGHSFRETAKGEAIVLNRDDLVECTMMLDAALRKHLDSFVVPQNALDVLAQHIVGMSLSQKWDVDDAFSLVKKVYAYHNLPKTDFTALIKYLAGNYVGLESRRVYGKIWYDEKENSFGKRGYNTKMIYMLNLGTIPDEVAVNVLMKGTKKSIGFIEEEFLSKLKPGDVFTLGGKLYKFDHAVGMKCFVDDGKGLMPTIPPWFSEQLPLSYELSQEIGRFRREFSEILERSIKKEKITRLGKKIQMGKEASEYLDKLPVDGSSKQALYGYFMEQLLFAKAVPTDRQLLIEQTEDPTSGADVLVFHSLYGRRVNDALSRAFAMELGSRLDSDIGVMINDNGFMLNSEEGIKLNAKALESLVRGVSNGDITQLLKKNIRNTELMKRRFRHVAARSFMILRNYKGFKIGVGRQQVNSQLIFRAAEEIDPDFPIIKEVYREIFNDMMDLPRAETLLSAMIDGTVQYKFIKTDAPSPFAHNLITFGRADVVLMKERHKYLEFLHDKVMKKIGG